MVNEPQNLPAPMGPPRPRRWKRLLFVGLAVIGLLYVVLTVLGFWLYLTHEDPEFINDQRFIETANERCADAQHRLDDSNPAGEDATNEERARTVENVTAVFSQLLTDLKALEAGVSPQDAPAVHRWLEKWEELVAVSPEYAAALRRGDRDEIVRIGNKGDEPSRYVNDFAEGNDMPECVF